MMKKTVGMLAAALFVVPAIASAQAGSWGFGAAATYTSLTGDVGKNTDPGIGVDGLVTYNFSSQFSLGGGASYQSFSTSNSGPDVHTLGIFADPRWNFAAMSPKLTPYIGGRLGWLHSTASQGGNDFKQNGFNVGAGLGLKYAMGAATNFDISAHYDYISTQDGDVNGSTISGSGQTGGGFGVRAGFNFMMGK